MYTNVNKKSRYKVACRMKIHGLRVISITPAAEPDDDYSGCGWWSFLWFKHYHI